MNADPLPDPLPDFPPSDPPGDRPGARRADRAAAAPSSPQPLTLDDSALRNRVAALGLKQWWLAEQAGVDRRTVLRWVNGQVRQIQPANLRRLAAVLGCAEHELLLATPQAAASALAGADEQRAAGAALAAGHLLDRLGPVHEWDVAEQLLKAVALPDLPAAVLGRLLHQLAVACWRQDKLDDAARHNATALALASRCGDRALQAEALGSRANLRWWRGELAAALADWQAALADEAVLGPRARGSLHNNLGAALCEIGRLDEGRARLLHALECFDDNGTAMNRSIARGLLALAALSALDAEDASAGDLVGIAEREALRSEAQARRADYRRGLAFALLLRAEVDARRGAARADVEARVEAGRAAFAVLGIRESLNERLAARALARAGAPEAARQALGRAWTWAGPFPLEQAELRLLQARLAAAADERRALALDAAARFERLGAPLKAERARALAA